ncbi:MAG: EamA family transporter [Methanomicrobiales archaeon]|nr:EamA family transporter [Methanomicrobiales archaeon]
MFWAILAATGACANAAYFILNKKFLEQLNAYLLAATCFLSTGVILLTLSWYRGFPAIGPDFFPAVGATVFLNIFGTAITFRALSSSDISLSIPMLSFTPLFLVGTAALLLGEYPSAVGILGILIIVTGSYVLNTSAEHERITDPFRAMISHPAVMGMLFVAFLYAIAINFDKMVVLNSDSYFGSGIVILVLGIAFGILAALARAGLLPPSFCPQHQPNPGTPKSVLQEPVPVRYLLGAGILTGCLLVVEAVTINTAYLLQIVPYVIAIKRMSIILVVAYGTIIFREKEVVRRLSGAGLMVLGAILILAFP